MGVRVLTVIGTRPEAIKLFPLIHALEADPRFESRVCVTGQHREMVDEVLAMAEIVPDYDLNLMRRGQRPEAVVARVLNYLAPIVRRDSPNWFVVQGDTATAFAASLTGYYYRIPVCHVEAGLRTGDLHHPWPEEAHRRMIAAHATLHCAPTPAAAAALLAENVAESAVHLTGNTGIDALHWVRRASMANPALVSQARALVHRAGGRRIVTVTLHRRESIGPTLEALAAALARLAERSDIALVLPLHPNPTVRRVLKRHLGRNYNVILSGPLDYPNFIHLLAQSTLILTDSGGVQEEAPVLGVPLLVVREATERPEAVAAGTSKLVGTGAQNLVAQAEHLLDDGNAHAAMARSCSPFGDGSAAVRIASLVAELT